MSIMFQPQSCRFMLYGPFNKIINDQLQSLPFEPVNGVRLSFLCRTNACDKLVSVDIDSEGNLSKVSVIDSETDTANMIFDFSHEVFFHYSESLDLICGHPLFHRLQQTTVAHYLAGHYSVNVVALLSTPQ